MEDYLHHSGSKQENRQVYARSFREEIEYGELIATTLKRLKNQIRDTAMSRIHISRKPLQFLGLERPEGKMLVSDSRN